MANQLPSTSDDKSESEVRPEVDDTLREVDDLWNSSVPRQVWVIGS
jgi:hypothetical protein